MNSAQTTMEVIYNENCYTYVFGLPFSILQAWILFNTALMMAEWYRLLSLQW